MKRRLLWTCLPVLGISACSGKVTEQPILGGSGAASGSGASNSGSNSTSGSALGSYDAGSTGSTSGESATPLDALAFGADASDSSDGADASSTPAAIAAFAFIVNGVAQAPLKCIADNWEFPPPTAQLVGENLTDAGDGGGTWPGQDVCNSGTPPCPGLTVQLANTGEVPIVYTVQPIWNAQPGAYPPGVPMGDIDDASELTGVLTPGSQIDITSSYVGGITAVLGSVAPFSNPDAGKYAGDEGTIPWPAGVAGSGGATEMHVAEINVVDACGPINPLW